MHKLFTDLNVGFSNAENYQRRENKELLTKYFVKDHFLDRLLDPNIFYLVGEKGTGKTAYSDYFDCVQGLIAAIWAINNDFLSNIKDSRGRLRIVLLVRPDIFLRTGLHNLNTKLRDNSVFLNWMTTYKDYRSSLLFRVADRLLSVQQDEAVSKLGDAWDYYFPFHAENVRASNVSDAHGVNSFLAFLRFSYYRPRDINAMIHTMQEIVRRNRETAPYVTAEDFNDPSFRDAHAEYLLGEIRDQLLFYYSQDEYDLFLQFFSHLQGRRTFSYAQFLDAFNEFVAECTSGGKELPRFFESSSLFLQFLYEQNVICYKEKDASENGDSELFIRWCFRERTLANMAPKVRVGVEYEVFYGLSKALNVGRPLKIKKDAPRRQLGTVISIDRSGGFGFIRGGEHQAEYYFKLKEFKGGGLRMGKKVSFEPTVKYGKPRAKTVRLAN
ncbi:cold-shock protein [Bradyrhizobium sp. USDA 4473]